MGRGLEGVGVVGENEKLREVPYDRYHYAMCIALNGARRQPVT